MNRVHTVHRMPTHALPPPLHTHTFTRPSRKFCSVGKVVRLEISLSRLPNPTSVTSCPCRVWSSCGWSRGGGCGWWRGGVCMWRPVNARCWWGERAMMTLCGVWCVYVVCGKIGLWGSRSVDGIDRDRGVQMDLLAFGLCCLSPRLTD